MQMQTYSMCTYCILYVCANSSETHTHTHRQMYVVIYFLYMEKYLHIHKSAGVLVKQSYIKLSQGNLSFAQQYVNVPLSRIFKFTLQLTSFHNIFFTLSKHNLFYIASLHLSTSLTEIDFWIEFILWNVSFVVVTLQEPKGCRASLYKGYALTSLFHFSYLLLPSLSGKTSPL